MPIAVKEQPKVGLINPKDAPKFRDLATMTEEELNDPDYAKKKLARDFGAGNIDVITCSKCHHCR